MQYRSPGSGEAGRGLRLSHFRLTQILPPPLLPPAVAAASAKAAWVQFANSGVTRPLLPCCSLERNVRRVQNGLDVLGEAAPVLLRRHLWPPIYGTPPSAALRGLGGIGCPVHGAPRARVRACALSLPPSFVRVYVGACVRESTPSRAGMHARESERARAHARGALAATTPSARARVQTAHTRMRTGAH